MSSKTGSKVELLLAARLLCLWELAEQLGTEIRG